MKIGKNKLLLLLLLLLGCAFPLQGLAEEEYAEEYEIEEEEEEIPESYYYPIESNELEGWPQGPAITAASAVVMDMDTGTFLYSKNAQAAQYPASITKIMTVLLLVENCDLDDTITFSDIVYDVEEGSSHIGIQPGEEMTLRDAAYGILLESANDAANGVAEYIAGSIEAFADMMNERAASLGCVNTHFANPHGLYREDHYTCAYDMALIAQAAYANPTFREIVTSVYHEIPETNMTDEIRYLTNHQKMMQEDSEYYQEWCTGGKTGYTEACLNTLVTFGEKDGKRLVAVVMRVNGAGLSYLETTDIMEYGFSEFVTENIEISNTNTDFCDIMNLRYLGKSAQLQNAASKEQAVGAGMISYTLPQSISIDQMQAELVSDSSESAGTIAYSYNGWGTGTAQGTYYFFAQPLQTIFEQTSELSIAQEETGDVSLQLESLEDARRWGAELLQMTMEYAKGHQLLVFSISVVAFLLLLLFVILLIFRSTAEWRIQKKRKQEEREREILEAQIEQMTTAEIEAELRQAMDEEERLRLLEEQRIEEAQKEAARQEEERLRKQETEELLEQLAKERDERIK